MPNSEPAHYITVLLEQCAYMLVMYNRLAMPRNTMYTHVTMLALAECTCTYMLIMYNEISHAQECHVQVRIGLAVSVGY